MPGFESLKILDFDHVELAVSDLDRAAELCLRLGFQKVATREILERKLRSYLLMQNGIAVLLSQSTLATDAVSRFVTTHGDGVINVGFRCEDAVSAFEIAVNRGAEIVETPKAIRRDFGSVQHASVRVFGDVRHTFISREGSLFAEGFEVATKSHNRGFGLTRIDHVSWSMEHAHLSAWTEYYERIFGLSVLQDGELRAMGSPTGTIRVSFGESIEGPRRLEQFLSVNHGAGIQNIAFASEDIFESMRAIRKEGTRLFEVPKAYYETVQVLPDRAFELEELGILVDGLPDRYLLQAFTESPVGSFAYEIVQRYGSDGFGDGNAVKLAASFKKEKSRKGILD